MAVAREQIVPVPAPVADPAAPVTPTEPSVESTPAAPEEQPQAEPAAQPESTGDPFVNALMEKAGAKTPEDLMAFVSTRIPDLMSQRDLARNEVTRLTEAVNAKDERWIGWIRALATRGLTGQAIVSEIDTFSRNAQQQRTTANASKAEALELINEAHEAGDARFAAFLKTLASAADGRLSREKLASYRTSFEKFAPAAAATTVVAKPVTKVPPTVPGAGANGGKEPSGPAWTGGDQARSLLANKKK